MTTNAYEAPQVAADATYPDSPGEESYAKERLKRPATALVIMSSIQSVFPAISLVSFGVTWFSGKFLVMPRGAHLFLLFNVAQLVWLILICIGAAKMAQLESRRMAYVAAWLSCIPIISPFVIVGIPFGIWALVRLGDPDIRAAFD